jgi:hypothetical protein
MLGRRFIRVTTDPTMQGPFAWPFKVLHDLFSNPPFVADPEFTSFDIEALRCKWTQKSYRSLDTPKSIFLNIDSHNSLFWCASSNCLVLFGLIIVS